MRLSFLILAGVIICISSLLSRDLYGSDVPASKARLYVDLSLSQAEKVFDIVSKTTVQRELRLSHEQMRALESLPNEAVPENWSSNTKNRREGADGPEDGSVEDPDERYFEFLSTSIHQLLTSSQASRLQEIVWQVDGLKSLRDDRVLCRAMNLSPEQDKEVASVFTFYDSQLNPIYKRLRAQMITSLSPDENIEEAEKNVNTWSAHITMFEKERDEALYSILTNSQKRQWTQMLGIPIQIKWNISVVQQ